MSLSYAKDLVDSLAQKMFAQCERQVCPGRGWIVIRVLPREHISQTGKIVLVESQQKVLLEGIVLRVFEPYWKPANHLVGREALRQIDEMRDGMAHVISSVHPGDHVLFPHFEGLPVGQILDENRYRLLEEAMVTAKLDYQPKGWLRSRLVLLLMKLGAGGPIRKRILDALESDFDIVPKNGVLPKTTSGR